MHFRIKKGLDLKLTGEAMGKIVSPYSSHTFFVHPSDFRWLTPKLTVQVGDAVDIGSPLFFDKEDERIKIVSPVNGTVTQIVRGEKRVIQTIVIERDNDTTSREVQFDAPISAEDYQSILLRFGLWPMLRQRPFSTIANPDTLPKALFVPCFDSAPLAPDYSVLLQGRGDEFLSGLRVMRNLLPDVPMHLCMREGADNALFEAAEEVEKHYFNGPHPAGNVGTHIHHIAPINKGESVWYIDPQDLATIGHLFQRKELCFDTTVALTGPCVAEPRYVHVPRWADLSELLATNTPSDNVRMISGNVLTGKQFDEYPAIRFYDHQLTMIAEGGQREFLGWLRPNLKKWSFSHTFLSWLAPKRPFSFNTSLYGGRRTFMMTDIYDKVFPFDIIPLSLLKACLVKDIENMEALGIYEVDDEDFALCEVVCPSKMECQQIIRDGLFFIKNDK